MTRTYLDFDLQIDEIDANTFRARVLNSPAGNAETLFDFPFSDLELENFFLRIGRPQRGVRGIDSPEMHEVRKFGSKLYKMVFQDTVHACLLRSMDKAEQGNNGLRLRLRLPPSLTNLPWEFLYDFTHERFLSHSTSTPIVRYLELAQPVKPLAVTLPLKVLVMIANPSDYERLDVEAEWSKIEFSLAELKQARLIELTRLPNATLNTLQRYLRRDQYHIFHFVGHGGFDQKTQDGVLLLENENGHSRLVSGNTLGTLFHDHFSLRLALLNACEGARALRSDPFAGVAQQLVKQGIPAVLGMQFEITDKAAILLAKEFYDALADGYSVDGAIAEARKSIYTTGNDIEWGIPVLYMRTVDGNLFNLPTSIRRTSTQLNTSEIGINGSTESNIVGTPNSKSHKPTSNVTKSSPQTQFWRQRWYSITIFVLLVIFAGVWQQDAFKEWLGSSLFEPTKILQPTPAFGAIVNEGMSATSTRVITTANSLSNNVNIPTVLYKETETIRATGALTPSQGNVSTVTAVIQSVSTSTIMPVPTVTFTPGFIQLLLLLDAAQENNQVDNSYKVNVDQVVGQIADNGLLGEDHTCISFMSFDNSSALPVPTVLGEWDCRDYGRIINSLLSYDTSDAKPQTPLFDLLSNAIKYFDSPLLPPSLQRQIVVFTNGFDISSRATLNDIIISAQEHQVKINPILLSNSSLNKDVITLKKLASTTGGIYFVLNSTNSSSDELWKYILDPNSPSPTPTASPSLTLIGTATPIPSLSPIIFNGWFKLSEIYSTEDEPVTFSWYWSGNFPLPNDYAFEVRVWQGGEAHNGIHNATLTKDTITCISNQCRFSAKISKPAGKYKWSVAVVKIKPSYSREGEMESPPEILVINSLPFNPATSTSIPCIIDPNSDCVRE